MRFSGLTDIGLKRDNNEDYIYLPREDSGIKLFVLADGMGGANAGEMASATAVKTVKDYIKNNFIKIERTKEELENLIRRAIVEANKKVLELANANEEYKGMGTTLIVVLIYRGRIHIGHVGDSRVYRLRQNVFRQITKDHSYVQELIRQGDITQEEAKNHPQRNVLLKAIGVEEKIKPDIITKGFVKGDIILVCSDGLTNMVDDKYIYEIIMKNIYDVNVACKKLVEKANYNGGLDNVSVILISN
ncbi:MAG: Stp1/IreP family PP2C-type Ser/Thr phosphatase [Clostridia bacterium]|nr:Stp1/IreP family PP2C-type Ser/Thr phosphatase [Clostridia bacterium]